MTKTKVFKLGVYWVCEHPSIGYTFYRSFQKLAAELCIPKSEWGV